MSANIPDKVRQGSTYEFSFDVEGDSISAFTYTLTAKQYPDDTTAFTKTLTTIEDNTVFAALSSSETASLDVGLWYLIVDADDPDENLNYERRVQVVKAWS
jgi:hypothetical protein